MIILLILSLLLLLLFKCKCSSFSSKNDTNKMYIINVEGPMGQERRDYIFKIMKSANVDYVFYPAYNKEKIDLSRYSKFEHKELTKGEIALAMTHNDLYKKLLASDRPYMIIAEDDCTVRPNFNYYLNKVIDTLPSDFDIIKLEYIKKSDGNIHNFEDNEDVPYNNSTKLTYEKNLNYPGTGCYIVSRKGAEYFLELNEPIWLPSDGAFDPYWQNKKNMSRIANTYYVIPQIAWQGYVKTII